MEYFYFHKQGIRYEQNTSFLRLLQIHWADETKLEFKGPNQYGAKD